MGKTIELTAADGHKFSAYRADPAAKPRGAVVVIQEIFGVNPHMRRVADDFASEGYVAITPALFDRARPGIELGYDGESIAKGRDIRGEVGWDGPLADLQAAIDAAQAAGKVATVGYCWGGSLAFLSATRLEGIAAAVGYYGGQIAAYATEEPKVPVLLHFGETDKAIPLTDVEKVRAAHPELPIHLYPAGHGFNCDERGDFNPDAAKLARARTLTFLAEKVG